ncbi:transposase [Streptomyces sp. NPDC012617]|uniref:transposase n=1 Tax=unclassified Streptomyces TaxID=2593676 RepID=UPI003409F3B8
MRAAPTHGRRGRRSCRSATKAAISEFAPTSAPSASQPTRSPHPRPHPAPSPAGYSAAPTPSPRENSSGSRPSWPTVPTGSPHQTCPLLRPDPHRTQGQHLPEWLDAVRQDDLPSLHTLAAGIDRDRDAVVAGLTLPWSSGVVEGHVNRIKMLKRQMFGRAGFDLLRKRVLLA